MMKNRRIKLKLKHCEDDLWIKRVELAEMVKQYLHVYEIKISHFYDAIIRDIKIQDMLQKTIIVIVV